jgi:hypothetical protein
MSPAEFMQRTVVRGPRIVLPSTWFSPFNDRFAALNRATCRTAVGREAPVSERTLAGHEQSSAEGCFVASCASYRTSLPWWSNNG